MKLVARELSSTLGRRRVLHALNLEICSGELVLLAGRNGAGKSTLLRLLMAAIAPDAGCVDLDGVNVATMLPRERARRICYVPQEADCPFEFTARELVTMGRHPHRGRFASAGREDRDSVEDALRRAGAHGFADRGVTTLSGGELRLVAMARALATGAPMLLLDEPTSNLDLDHALHIASLLRRLADEGRGVLVASHDLNLFAPLAHRAALLHEGRVLVAGAPESALTAETFATVFAIAATDPDSYFPRAFDRL